MANINMENIIYKGPRGPEFKKLIHDLLKRGNLKEKYINILLDNDSMLIYNDAFTASSANVENNYEVFEQLGDVTANKFIVWYMHRRFPQLNCALGVKIVARLRINYGAKQSFSKIAESLGFWDFISASEEERNRRKKSLLEDVLESIIGAIEFILDTRIAFGVGYAIVYDILSSIFDDMNISLLYDDLYDPKTRLKELFDMHGGKLGKIAYEESKTGMITTSTLYRLHGGQKIKIGSGSAALKSDAQQRAATDALRYLKSQGYEKLIPPEYKYFCV